MILHRLGMGNFMSFDSAMIPLHNQGLVLIRGDNTDNDALSDNGAGKSTVIEAIVYALFGRTIRGLKADQVVNRHAKKNCWVELVLEDDNHNEYIIQRYRKHAQYGNKSRMLLNGVDVTPASESAFNDKVVEILGADYTTFTSSVLYTGESFKFTSATDAEMKRTFDLMLGTSLYQSAKDVASRKQSEVMSQLRLETQASGALLQSINELESTLAVYSSKSDEWVSLVAQTRKQLADDVAAAEQRVTDSQQEELTTAEEQERKLKAYQDAQNAEQKFAEGVQLMDTLRQSIAADRASVQSLNKQFSNAHSAVTAAEKSMSRERVACELAHTAFGNAQRELDAVLGSVGAPCPYCGRTLTSEHLEQATSKAREALDAKRREVEAAEESKELASKNLRDAESYEASLSKEIGDLEQKVTDNIALLRKAEATIGSQYEAAQAATRAAEREYRDAKSAAILATRYTGIYQKELDKARQALSGFNDANPYTELISGVETDIAGKRQQLDQKKSLLDELEKQSIILAFWVQAFSNQGIKSFILDSVTPYLNQRANYYLGMLSDSHISVNFTTQTKLKSNEVREKFSIEVTNDDGGNMYIANSGGERKRVDLAINLALQDLVASRSCHSICISVWDEVFDALDETGCEAVIRMLQELSAQRSTILVISHNQTIQSYFSKVWTVTKHEGMSTIHI